MIEGWFRVTVPMVEGDVQHPVEDFTLDAHDFLFEIHTRKELDDEFERDFIRATDGSFNAETDGYNGNMFADYGTEAEAAACDERLKALAVKWEKMVIDTLRQEAEDLENDC